MIKHDYCEINRIYTGPFKYVLSTGPIDWFNLTLSKEQLVKNLSDEEDYSYFLNGFDCVNSLDAYIKRIVTEIEEEPHIIRYTSIPSPDGCNFELVVVAKISNNGTCFIFSNNLEYLQSIRK